MLPAGIDISKKSFDITVIVTNEQPKHRVFLNNLSGFKQLTKWVSNFEDELAFCMEATGVYWLNLANYLSEKGCKTVVCCPNKTHAFAKVKLNRNKTDKADSRIISEYCNHLIISNELEENLYKPKTKAYKGLQDLVYRLDQLKTDLVRENNRLESVTSKDIIRSIKSFIKKINTEINKTNKLILELIASHSELSNATKKLKTIQGIADKTAWAILAYLGDISRFSNSRKVVAYAGLSPALRHSGTSVMGSSLSKIGHKKLRKALYMPAMVAMRHNPVVRDFYQKLLANGKPKKVALIASMRKLLVISYGVLKSDSDFDPNYAC